MQVLISHIIYSILSKMRILQPSMMPSTMCILKTSFSVSAPDVILITFFTTNPIPIKVTATEKDDNDILKNQIGQAIVRRIIRAHEERDNFKVMVLMPLMPAFPADLSTKEAANAR